MIDTALQYTASMTMRRDFDTVSGDGIIDELIVLRDKSVKTLLNNVISVQIFDECDHVERESANDRDNLVVVLRISLVDIGDCRLNYYRKARKSPSVVRIKEWIDSLFATRHPRVGGCGAGDEG